MDPRSLIARYAQQAGARGLALSADRELLKAAAEAGFEVQDLGKQGPKSADQMQMDLLDAGFGDVILTPELVLARAKPKPRDHQLSVVVPIYNEAATCGQVLDQLLAKTIPGLAIEIIIVESMSSDGSRQIVERYSEHPRVLLILQDRPRGKGHAVRQGLAAATGTIVLIQDGDLEYDMDDYEALLTPILENRANFVLGSRHTENKTRWKIRKFNDSVFLGRVFNFGHFVFLTLFNRLYGQTLSDPFTMYKVFRRECLYGLRLECDRFDFDHELVIKLIRKGFQPLEVPVSYVSRSPTEGKKVTLLRDPLTWIVALLKFRRSPLYEL